MVEHTGMRGIPFDATQILNDDGSYSYDNVYNSEDFAEWFRQYFGDGILIPSGTTLNTQLEVVKSSTSKVTIKPGAIVVAGRNGILYNDFSIDVSTAASGKKRIDRVVVEMNEQQNRFNLKLVEGEEASNNPVKPELTRGTVTVGVEVYEIYQMSLAAITVDNSGVVSIEDERSGDLCGVSVVIPGVEKPKLPTGDSAENISYDGTQSGSIATTVQGAIDDIYTDINSMQGAIDILEESVSSLDFSDNLETTLSLSGWTENQQTVTVNGITADMTPIIDVIATTAEDSEEWGKIYRVTTGANSLTFYAKETPTKDLNVHIKVVK